MQGMLKGCLHHTLQNKRRCLRPTCSMQGGDSDSKWIPTELAWEWHGPLSSHGGPEQGNENVIEK